MSVCLSQLRGNWASSLRGTLRAQRTRSRSRKSIGVVLQVKRVGVGGRLVAFFKAVCVYFALAPAASPSAAAVAAKVAPVLCLLLLVLLPRARATPSPAQ